MDFIPKNNTEAEESLIASLFMNNTELDNCLDLIPGDFYKPAYSIIFKAILILINKKEVADLVTVGHYIDDNGGFDSIGGHGTIVKIANNAPLSLNVKAHAKIIKDCAMVRRILTTALNVVDMCRADKPPQDLLDFSQSEFLRIESKDIEETVKPVKDIISNHIDLIEKANTVKETGGFRLGLPVIDRRLSVKGPKLIIIAGRPGMGKSSLLVTIARNMDREGIKTGILNLEMSEQDMLDKFLAVESGVDSSKFDRYHGLSVVDYENLTVGCSVLSRSDILLDSTGNLNCSQVAQRARKMVKEGAQVIFIDQLSQIKGMNSTEDKDRFARYSANVNRISMLKKELGVPIFLLAQLNRKLEQRMNKEPMLSDLKMAGDIEEDADTVLFLYRPGVYEDTKKCNEEQRTIIEAKTVINMVKNRKGGTVRTDKVLFNNKTQYFYMEE